MLKQINKYTLMHKNITVADLELDSATGVILTVKKIYASEHLPVGTMRKETIDRKMLNVWWHNRTIPASRFKIQAVLEQLKLTNSTLLAERCFGLSLSDQYWLKPANSSVKWSEINFFDNSFSTDIGNLLFEQPPDNKEIDFISPDSTSDGWLKKRWVIVNGQRCLIKGGSGAIQQEPYNEVLASRIMERLNIAHVPYNLLMQDNYPYCICEDFIDDKTELISAGYIMNTEKQPNHISTYNHFINCCEKLDIANIQTFLNQMLTFDFLIVNEDRHFHNFGLIRNAETLEYIGIAPIYDSGTSLWYNKPTGLINPKSKAESKPFKDTHSEQIKLVKDFSWFDFAKLNGIDEELRIIFKDSIFIDERRCEALCIAMKERINMLQQIANK